ncbi:alpha/beta hydrolase family protein [Pseudonocardia endophytica]|uniref:2,6-dihydroxypseudooxynicotine hydrolase n=1 Tax=Pseudonocardia endophytica TaxID=401976 RepID=A0A4R1HJ21_PSEEN|nr:alpha/beta hydrolase [Pseudonocardia endophytica]TCK21838.1 2,6-dihydroxypseudooxynicotine hydrolase [Pseudonocardia endophytica]
MSQPDAVAQLEHLVHRFVSNGVPLADVEQIRSDLTDWSSWNQAWQRSGDARMAEAEAADRAGAHQTAAELRLVAALEFHFGKFLFVHDVVALRRGTERAAGAYRRALVRLPWPGRVLDVPYRDRTLPGVFRTPAAGGPAPTVLLVPGLDAAKEELHLLSEVFLRRGMATMVVDGPGQGESEFDLPLTAEWEEVAEAVLDVLRGRHEVDRARVGVVGVSLGGHYAARTAARADGIRAGVSLGGCYSMGESWPHLKHLSRDAFRVRTRSSDMDAASAEADRFTLASAPARGGVPFLVVHGERDRLFDTEQAERMAKHFGPDGELTLEPDGNHVLHNIGYRIRPAAADWLRARLDG